MPLQVPLSDRTVLLTQAEMSTRRDIRGCDFYLTERHPGKERVVPYNKQILLAWGANMDLQLVGSMYATNVYVGGYMTKCETEGLSARIPGGIEQAAPHQQCQEEVVQDWHGLLSSQGSQSAGANVPHVRCRVSAKPQQDEHRSMRAVARTAPAC